MNKKKSRMMYLIPAILICLVIVYICTVVGAANVHFSDANRILLNKMFGMGNISDLSTGDVTIIWDIRLPRIILGFIAGSSLAVCGAGYQGIFKNPMADPFILGVSSGAALGAAIGIVLHFSSSFLGFSGTTLLAFAGSFAAIGLVYSISRVGGKVPVSTLLLSGVAVNSTLSSVMSLIMMLNRNSMDQIMFWTMGSLNGKGWQQIITVLPWVIIGIVVLFASSRELDIMLTGEETATQLGINVEMVKRKVLIASSLITAAVISVTGIIGFVGLVVPHVVRLLTGPKHKILLPTSLVFGGAFLVICDTVARSATVSEIPVGVVTAVCGGPFFLYLLRKTKRGGVS
ncbi:MAG: iron chelate uptake ABC transporter family permease subunit [Lachnospiraceae bacterium]|nr:iron chelate uptake ABC transporter family permease subunit [Lachnospiraceae bacterium]